MKSIRLVEVGQPLVEEQVEEPHLGPHDVRVAVGASGICRSDVHYRSGSRSLPNPPPLTLGHEIAGTITDVGEHVSRLSVGDRVAIHYLVTCGLCEPCLGGLEPFCDPGEMIGLDRDGGYADSVTVPSRNAYPLPDSISLEVAAIMMCSTSTSLHALRRGRFEEGESVAVFGCGGLGVSAIKLAKALGASEIYGIDINDEKLAIAEGLGAIPVPFPKAHRIEADVVLELVGLPDAMKAAVGSLRVRGRAVAVGITDQAFDLNSYSDLAIKEAEVIGVVDHLGSEIAELIEMVDGGDLDLSDVVTASIPLEAGEVNAALDRLESFDGGVRTVIKPSA